MADTAVVITAGTGTNIDTRTEASNGNHRQVIVIGDPSTNAGVAPVDATNGLAVDVKASALPSGAATGAKQDTGNSSLASIDGKITAVNTGAVTVSAALPAGNNNIGDVDVASLPALAAGTNGIGKLTANSGVDIGDVTLTAGTAAVGTLLPPDIDVTANTNYAKKYYTNSGAVTDGIIWSPAAGKRWHVHTIYLNVSAAATVTLEDDKTGGDEAVWKGEIAANSGVIMTFPEKYPWASGEDAADLMVTTSAGNVYVTVSGYEI